MAVYPTRLASTCGFRSRGRRRNGRRVAASSRVKIAKIKIAVTLAYLPLCETEPFSLN